MTDFKEKSFYELFNTSKSKKKIKQKKENEKANQVTKESLCLQIVMDLIQESLVSVYFDGKDQRGTPLKTTNKSEVELRKDKDSPQKPAKK